MANTEVVLVHGLWYGSWSMASLARRLRRAGHALRYFTYRSTTADLAGNADSLAQFVRGSNATRVHYVGHSLGGLVILQMLCNEPLLPPGRVVLLGTPLRGSAVVRNLARFPPAQALLGQAADSLSRGFSDIRREGTEGREIGMIAGTRPFGLGRLLGQSADASDGTVALDETRAPFLHGHVSLAASHTGLLYSTEVARQVCSFLDSGRFLSPGACPDSGLLPRPGVAGFNRDKMQS